MKHFKLSMVLMLVPVILLMLFSVVFAADGVSQANTWQTATGVFAFLTTGAGAWILKNMKIIKELREAVAALVQAFVAVEIFARKTPGILKEDQNFINMMRNLDRASEEIADVLENITPMKKYAAVLRKAIKEASYTHYDDNAKMAIWGAFENMSVTRTFKSALAELSK